MIHEILLALSGHPSPLLPSPSPGGFEKQRKPLGSFSSLISPSEEALLGSLSRLSELHRKVSSLSALIANSHSSTICRAVSSAIVSTHLTKFQAKVLEVESDILKKDAGSVGSGTVVPLSSVVTEFNPWIRRMEWFWDLIQFINGRQSEGIGRVEQGSAPNTITCTGARIINHLREQARTGYPDLEEISLDLSDTAERAWLRQLSAWVLYGKLPSIGADDFMVQDNDQEGLGDDHQAFHIVSDLAPSFVSSSTQSSILFIGRSLGHIRSKGGALSELSLSSSTAPELALLPAHHRHLSAVVTPIDPINLTRAISAIRLSLSQTLLKRLLPFPRILETLQLLRSFFLLGRGEFAVTLIVEADVQIQSRRQGSSKKLRQEKLEGLDLVNIKEGELTSTLNRTWATLSSLELGEYVLDEELELARDAIHLEIPKSSSESSPPSKNKAAVSFDDLLFSTPTVLSLDVSTPLDLFLSKQDVQLYASMNSYMLSIRRAHLRLTDLWKHTALRRDHPAPLGPPHSNTQLGEDTNRLKRRRTDLRARKMRRVWATIGAAVFLLGEVGEYFQGDVVSASWNHFNYWLNESSSSEPVKTEAPSARVEVFPAPRPNASHPSRNIAHDPETLSLAHQTYLSSLFHFLLMGDEPFARALHDFLLHAEHLIACVSWLESSWLHLDLQSDEGVVDAFVDYDREERRASRELENIRETTQEGVGKLIDRLRDLDAERAGTGSDFRSREEKGGYLPWRPAGIDRLLMKLDFGSFVQSRGANWQGKDEDDF
ncbi:MAG: hypothetical protein M4579_002121 [Chaenotheca gracillima]|nr:MAG: hypothetical protein M4579_002121 [Chaenotheca gracillima]